MPDKKLSVQYFPFVFDHSSIFALTIGKYLDKHLCNLDNIQFNLNNHVFD